MQFKRHPTKATFQEVANAYDDLVIASYDIQTLSFPHDHDENVEKLIESHGWTLDEFDSELERSVEARFKVR